MKIFKDDRQSWLTWRISMIIFNLFALFLYVLVFCLQEFEEKKHSVETNGTHLSLLASLHMNATEYGMRRKHDVLGGWKYLTRWNHVLQILTFLGTLLPHYWFLTRNVDFFKKLTKTDDTNPREVSDFQRRYTRTYDTAFHSLSVPGAFLVSFLYWTLRAVNPELVLNKNPDHRSPWFNDHVVHTAITPIILIELIFAFHERPALLIGIGVLLTFYTCYIIVTFANGIIANIWAYGILEKLNWPFRILFIIGCGLVFIFFYLIGGFIFKFFWTDENRKNFFLYGEKENVESKQSDQTQKTPTSKSSQLNLQNKTTSKQSQNITQSPKSKTSQLNVKSSASTPSPKTEQSPTFGQKSDVQKTAF